MACEKKEHKIGGVIAFVIIIVLIIVLAVVLSADDGNNNNKSDSDSSNSSGNDTTTDDGNSSSTTTKSHPADNKNILFIIVDDFGWSDISVNGLHDCEYTTPNLDSLYTNGIEFTNYYVHPVCTPTRGAALTGKYGWKLGLQDIQTLPPACDELIAFTEPTIAELLRDSELNYKTYYVGKWHLGYANWDMTPIGRGFDKAFGMLQARNDFYDHSLELLPGENIANYPGLVGYDLFDMTNQKVYWKGNNIYSTDLFYDFTIEYLQDYIDNYYYTNPFYMYLSWQTIHEPIQVPPRNYSECNHIQHNGRKIYCNKILYLDEKMGNLTQFLKDNSIYNDTLIIFTTDNGGIPYFETPIEWTFPDSYGCNEPYRGGKTTLFQGGVKGLGALSGQLIDDMDKSNTQSELLIHTVDWVTTIVEGFTSATDIYEIAEQAGFTDMEKTFDGINIKPYIDGSMSESLFDRYYLPVNLDMSNALKKGLKEILWSEYFAGNYSTIIWNDIDNNRMWKYIIGKNLYWNYYHCNQTVYRYNENLYNFTFEYLFDLTTNPYEYEELNFLSPNMTDDILLLNNLTELQVNITRNHLQEKIYEYVYDSGEYVQGPQQGTHVYLFGLPACHNFTWSPWLDSDMNLLVDDISQCQFAVNFTLDNDTDVSKYYISQFRD